MFSPAIVFAFASILCVIYGFVFSHEDLELIMTLSSNTFVSYFSTTWVSIGLMGLLFSFAYWLSKNSLYSCSLIWWHVIFFVALCIVLVLWELDMSDYHNTFRSGEFSSERSMRQFAQDNVVRNERFTIFFIIFLLAQFIYFVNLTVGLMFKKEK